MNVYEVVAEGKNNGLSKPLAVCSYLVISFLGLMSCVPLIEFFYEVDYTVTASIACLVVLASLWAPAPRFLRSPELAWVLLLWSSTLGCYFVLAVMIEWYRKKGGYTLGWDPDSCLPWGSLFGLVLFAVAYLLTRPKPKTKGGRRPC